MDSAALLAALLVGAGVATILTLMARRKPPPPERAPAPPPADTGWDSFAEVRDTLGEFFSTGAAHPRDLQAHPAFEEGIRQLERRGEKDERLLAYYTGESLIMACLALETLGRRQGQGQFLERVLEGLNSVHPWSRYFAFRLLVRREPRPAIVAVLLACTAEWEDVRLLSILREFIGERAAGGESPAWGDRLEGLPAEQLAFLDRLLVRIEGPVAESLRDELRRWREQRIDRGLLNSIGSLWSGASGARETPLDHPSLNQQTNEIEATLEGERPAPVLVVGEAGVGKTTLVHAVARRLEAKGWVIFQASATDLIANQSFVGNIEGRIRALVEALGRRQILWVIPSFHELLWVGRHFSQPNVGLLDLLLPYFESGALKVIGETRPAAHGELLRARPKLRTVLQVVRVAALDERDTLELAARWAATQAGDGAILAPETAREALQLARQYTLDRESPGNLLDLLRATWTRVRGTRGVGPMRIPDVLETLAQLTGLPLAILDERESLDLPELRRFFARRVLGQPEAVDCLVERVAMIKAGLTDPGRPLGVFMFVGPTGTGKTAIARALAEYLFGSPERMIRLDMSEFNSPADLDRLLGSSYAGHEGDALVQAIRRQPFSVVLLDEFEKAAPPVWDLFLQLFDAGRLTDRRGDTADFRHSIVILTSNLGARQPFGASFGFTGASPPSAARVEKALAEIFRREFLNRLDRVVLFQPLGQGVMRDILRKELDAVLTRRGLRSRSWAVEWDESALEFLLARGFSPDLGARPLQRAIERYVLSPLALTIVDRQAPEGDQFLFVRSDGSRIQVEFVDPDAPEATEATPELARSGDGAGAPVAPSEGMRLETLALGAEGSPEEVAFLRTRYECLRARLGTEGWSARKENALARMSEPDFWNAPERFGVLGLAEYIDRIERAFHGSASLLERLRDHSARTRPHAPRGLVRALSERLLLLDLASHGVEEGRPREAFLMVRAGRGAEVARAPSNAFASRLGAMYRGWAEKRRMQLAVLDERNDVDAPYHLVLAVSGFAAFQILEPESGLHVLEAGRGQKARDRVRAWVRVVPQPEAPAGKRTGALRKQALAQFAAHEPVPQRIVRRYREGDAPLVRDGVRGWRTGRVDLVLGGDFDLVPGNSAADRALRSTS